MGLAGKRRGRRDEWWEEGLGDFATQLGKVSPGATSCLVRVCRLSFFCSISSDSLNKLTSSPCLTQHAALARWVHSPNINQAHFNFFSPLSFLNLRIFFVFCSWRIVSKHFAAFLRLFELRKIKDCDVRYSVETFAIKVFGLLKMIRILFCHMFMFPEDCVGTQVLLVEMRQWAFYV